MNSLRQYSAAADLVITLVLIAIFFWWELGSQTPSGTVSASAPVVCAVAAGICPLFLAMMRSHCTAG